MSTTETPFYVTGGTLQQDAPSYVERRADTDLFEGLSRGEFCYVLTSRQMGKSSLMIHTAARLRSSGIAVVVLDLTAIGQNLEPEQWYGGLLRRLGRQLDLEDALDDFWMEHEQLGPLQRWMTALEEIVLARVPGRIVIFVDEIDAVRSLRFSTDEFFSGIRECYNRRTQDPAFQRLTFCLLGVASPADLISDQRTSPFNIGRRIALTDFVLQEALPLALGLERGRDAGTGRRLLDRVLSWTGGQPYLTQRLCRVVAEDEKARTPADVDRWCDALFLSRNAREVDDNLAFVRNRLLRSEVDLPALLDLYRKVQRGQRVKDDETSPLVTVLRLSGVVRVEGGVLRPRNRIYDRVFDREWVTEHMPGAELRRQRAAYRRGLVRAAAVAGVIIAIMAGLAGAAITNAERANDQTAEAAKNWRIATVRATRAQREAERARREAERANRNEREARASARQARESAVAEQKAARLAEAAQHRAEESAAAEAEQRRRAQEQERRANTAAGEAKLAAGREKKQRRLAQERALTAQRTLYAAQLNLAQQAWEAGSVRRALDLLEGQRPAPGQEDRRGFEWRHLWHLCQGDARATVKAPDISGVALSPDGRILATGSDTGAVRLLDVLTGREIQVLRGHTFRTYKVAFSPDGRLLATSSIDKSVKLWDVAARKEVGSLQGHTDFIGPMALSPDGKLVASGSGDGSVKLWDVATRRELATIKGYTGLIYNVVFSPDSRRLALLAGDGTLWLWDIPAQRPVLSVKLAKPSRIAVFPDPVAFSPDGKSMVTPDGSTVRRWDATSGQELAPLSGHTDDVVCLAFSPDGKTLATGGNDQSIRLWDAASGQELASLVGHAGAIQCLAFSADGQRLASGSWDSTVKLWDLGTRREMATFRGHKGAIYWMAFTADGQTLATASGNANLSLQTINLWDLARGESATVLANREAVRVVAYSPDGKLLATGGAQGTIRLWDGEGGLQASLGERGAAVTALAFAPDSHLLASGSEDGTGRLWDLPKGELRATLRRHRLRIAAMAFSADGHLLASGGALDQTVRFWDGRTGQPRGTLHGMKGGVSALAFSPDGQLLAESDGDTLRLWQVATFWPVRTLPDVAEQLAFRPDSKTLIAIRRRFVILWNVATGRKQELFQLPAGAGGQIALSPDGRNLAAVLGSTVTLWNLTSKQEVASLKGHTGAVTAAVFSPDSRTLVTASNDATVRLWRAASLRDADTTVVAASSGDRTVRLQWRPVPHAVGYQVSRGPAGAPRAQLVKLHPQPLTGTTFTDRSPGLVNDQAHTYEVAPLFRGAAGTTEEGIPATLQAAPVGTPPGWTGSSINAGEKPGSVLIQPEKEAAPKGGSRLPAPGSQLAARKPAPSPAPLRRSAPVPRAPRPRPRREPALGQITLRGSGSWMGGPTDGCYFMNRPVTGDFQVTVQMLTAPTGTESALSQTGLMVRESLDPGARRVLLFTRTDKDLRLMPRIQPNGNTPVTAVLGSAGMKLPILLRLTRRGDTITAEYSQDGGKSFRPAGEPVKFAEPLPQTLYAGLGIASFANPSSEAKYRDLKVEPLAPQQIAAAVPQDRSAAFLDVDPLQVILSSGDREVRLQWQPLPSAIGYHVYRGPAVADRGRMVKLTARPVPGDGYTDRSSGLVNGQTFSYAVAPVFPAAGGKAVEETLVLAQSRAVPGPTPPGFVGTSIDEGPNPGSALFQPGAGTITLRGSGRDFWLEADGGYFLNQPLTGDFRITATLQSGPTETFEWAKAGLMLRESLAPTARDAYLVATPKHGLNVQWRGLTDQPVATEFENGHAVVIQPDALRHPITLRLTRRGDRISAAYSLDGGKSFQPAGEPLTFRQALPETLYAGLAITSHVEGQIGEAKFRDVKIEMMGSGR